MKLYGSKNNILFLGQYTLG